MRWICLLLIFSVGCTPQKQFSAAFPQRASTLTGTEFYKQAAAMSWKQRDSFAIVEVLAGNVPDFFKEFIPIKTEMIDGETGVRTVAEYYVSPDYLCIGTNADWARIPLTPMAAQIIADSLECFLPTKKMVDDIYENAPVKLEPVPLYAYRDSTPTMFHHHLIIEGQRRSRAGLIAGIKKDVVISGKVSRDQRPNRVAIYGWHKPDGKPIQPLYTGHVNWYVDYSHGIRLVSRKIRVWNKWMDYSEVLAHPLLRRLLCDEEYCDFLRYPL